MKTFEELRQSAQVLTREQMRMIVGGQDDYTYYCKAVCADGTEHMSKNVKDIDSFAQEACGDQKARVNCC